MPDRLKIKKNFENKMFYLVNWVQQVSPINTNTNPPLLFNVPFDIVIQHAVIHMCFFAPEKTDVKLWT